MKAAVIYFSQTGNTRKVARAINEGLKEAGWDTVMTTLKKAGPDTATGCDLVAVGTPCFSSRAPQPVLDYLATLPDLGGARALVFATSGGGPGRVLYEMTEALRDKGAEVIDGTVVRGECFHPFPSIKGRFPGRPDENDLARAREFGKRAALHVAAGTKGPVAGARRDALHPGKGFYDAVARLNTDDQLRAILPPPLVDRYLCDKCKWCMLECPTSSIVMDPWPRIIGDKCLRCYRCYSGCPKSAFNAKMRLGDLMSMAFYNTIFERWLGDVKKGEDFY